jgi:hypothetical protein
LARIYYSIVACLLLVVGGDILLANTSLGNHGVSGQYCSDSGELSKTKPNQSHRSYCIKSNVGTAEFKANQPTQLSFSLIDNQGRVLTAFETVHEKIMHVIVVRNDLTEYQHLHPDYNQATGEFSLKNLVFPSNGQYRLFADFTPVGEKNNLTGRSVTTPSKTLRVGDLSTYKPVQLGSAHYRSSVNGYDVVLSTDTTLTAASEEQLSFRITQAGKTVTRLEPYLGAMGHVVILSEHDLDFIHAHPVDEQHVSVDGVVDFMTSFPKAGRYKVFAQFQVNGNILTSDFIVEVGLGNTTPTTSPDSMNHEMMGH